MPGTFALSNDKDGDEVDGVSGWVVYILPEESQDKDTNVNFKLRTWGGKIRVRWYFPEAGKKDGPITSQREAIERGRWKPWASANKSRDDQWVYRWQIKAATTEKLRADKGNDKFELIKLTAACVLYKTSIRACHEAEVLLSEGNPTRGANAERDLDSGSGSGSGDDSDSGGSSNCSGDDSDSSDSGSSGDNMPIVQLFTAGNKGNSKRRKVGRSTTAAAKSKSPL